MNQRETYEVLKAFGLAQMDLYCVFEHRGARSSYEGFESIIHVGTNLLSYTYLTSEPFCYMLHELADNLMADGQNLRNLSIKKELSFAEAVEARAIFAELQTTISRIKDEEILENILPSITEREVSASPDVKLEINQIRANFEVMALVFKRIIGTALAAEAAASPALASA